MDGLDPWFGERDHLVTVGGSNAQIEGDRTVTGRMGVPDVECPGPFMGASREVHGD